MIAAADGLEGDAFERKLYVIRRVAELAAGPDLVVPSLSSRTLVYKGMLTAPQLEGFYLDLADPRVETALALVHSRYSTNTFPSWELAHPYRYIAHNGEINTLRGNVNWMRARESQLASELFGDDLAKVLPVIRPGGSDTGDVRQRARAARARRPLAAARADDDDPGVVRGSRRHDRGAARLLRVPPVPDGSVGRPRRDRVHRRPRDRRDARPQRPPPGPLVRDGGRLGRARIRSRRAAGRARRTSCARGGCSRASSSSSTSRRAGSSPTTRSSAVATQQPYAEWVEREQLRLSELPPAPPTQAPTEPLRSRQLLFGYAQEDMNAILAPLARNAEEPVGSMGNDTPLAALTGRKPLLYSYFKQLFAQVTNPPIDSIREAIVMSVRASVGSERNLLDETPEHARQLVIDNPILLDRELEQLRMVDSPAFTSWTIDTTWPAAEGADGLERAVDRICDEASVALAAGANILILSDRSAGPARVPPLPARNGLRAPSPRPRGNTASGRHRRRVGRAAQRAQHRRTRRLRRSGGQSVSDARDARRARRARLAPDGMTADDAQRRATKGIAKGLLKTMSKMGISTMPSYCGAQIFEAVGLAPELVERHFTGTRRASAASASASSRRSRSRGMRARTPAPPTRCCP